MITCRNCHGEQGIHQYETLRCPRNGMESAWDRPQLWQETFWNDGKNEEDIETLRADISALHLIIQNLMRRIEILEES